jgi:RimJ/RimL family protein N-acetyltransferase
LSGCEIGWRIGSRYWGCGYVTEAAQKALAIGFINFNLSEIVSFTVPDNRKSINVMERLGMHRDLKGDFYHTAFPKEHPLALHMLYRLTREEYLDTRR